MSEEWLSVADIRAAQARSSEEGLPDNHVVTIVERTLTVDIPELIQNNIKTDTVTLELDSEWDGISPVIIFECSDADYQVQYEGAATHIPQAVMKNTGSVGCSVCGYDDTGEVRLVTKAAPSTFSVVASGSFIGEISEDDVSLLGQILAAADAANAAANKVENASFTATATTLEPGESATAQITGDDLKMTVAFGIPKGETGEPGVAATIAVGTVTTGEPGTDAAVSNSGTAQAAVLDFTIPKGDAPVRGVDYWTAEDVEQVVADAKAQAVAELAEIGNVPKRTVSDLVAHGEDAYAQKPIEVRVKGKTRQNLWVNPSWTQDGITVTSNDDGSITVEGTATQRVTINTKSYALRAGSSYTASSDKKMSDSWHAGQAGLGAGFCVLYRSSANVSRGQTLFGYGDELTKSFVVPSDAARVEFYVIVEEGFNVSGTYRVMLNEGSEAEPWCPPGLNSVDELSLVTAGKNLWQSPATQTNNGITFTQNDDGSFTLEGSLSAASPSGMLFGNSTVAAPPPGSQVTLSVDSALSENYVRVILQFVNSGGDVLGGNNYVGFGDTLSKTMIVPSGVDHISLGVYVISSAPAGTAVSGTYHPQLELGSTATAYEPPNVTTTPLPEVELRSLPNGTCDELVIGADGTCEVERNTGIWTFTGSENWARDPAIGGIEIPYFGCTFSGTSENVPRINWGGCNDRLPVENPYTYSGDCFYIFANGSGYIARIRKSGCNDVASIKEWLASNNVHAVYGAVDTTEPQTSVTLPVLPAPTFNQYHDGDIPSDTSVNYARDINIVLSNLEAVQTALLGGEE